ncbi:tetratricopeptide (TPR) repeat protein [Actinoplanes tereljensis]|uniref:FxSxx-COOH system tetratricopeptide repeat protein n=1 Tax=Paractinoplanes tereljensis TaxID=571912 RepID=UPI001944F871|nr:FxSxx-COOH system tetratricopeptide repeat protein [Actinoplanes tereljensis]
MAGHVFISYSRRDTGYVDQLAERLERDGIPLWLDRQRLEAGDQWERQIRDRVDDCAVLIVVMSPAAEASPHVGNELQRARDRGKPVLPILLSGENWFELGRVNYFDARPSQLPDQRFLDRLRRLISGSGEDSGGSAARSLVAGDLPGRAVAWQDRPGLLDAVVQSAADGGTAVVAALAGQRGVGKTQLAAAYARLRVQHGWPVVVWANAESEPGIVTALDELATLAGLRKPGEDPRDAARTALRWLRAQPGPCLLVFDNALDADLIREWTPAIGSVHTVVTSTLRALDELGELIDVSLFTQDEAVDYLRRRTHLADSDGALEVSERLGWLPLALAQAGALIGPSRRYPGYDRYLQAMASRSIAELLPRPAGNPYPYGLAEAVLLSLEDLGRDEEGVRARQLLDRLAVLAPIGADPLLLACLVESDREDAEMLAALLTGRSLTVGADADRVVIHRLVQQVVREHCQTNGTLGTVVTATAAALRASADQIGGDWQQRTLLAEYAEHAESLLGHATTAAATEAVASVLHRLIYYTNEAHSHSTSIAHGTTLISARERALGADHPDTLNSRSNVAFAYWLAGRFDEAIMLHTAVLADRKRVQEPNHPDTLVSRHGLAAAYQSAGQLEEAIALFTAILADQERIAGHDHPDTLKLRNNLANAYASAGRLDEAISMHTATLADRERVLGTDHPDTLISRSCLAYDYRAAGRLDEAMTLLTATLADQKRILGHDHPDTLVSRNNLAFAYRAVGRLDEAITLYAANLADRMRVLGEDHPHTQNSRNGLIYAYQAAGRLEEAAAVRQPPE